MKYFWGKPVGSRVVVRNLKTVFSFRESELSPPLYMGTLCSGLVLWRKYFRPQRALGLETVVVEKNLLTCVNCLLPGVLVCFN